MSVSWEEKDDGRWNEEQRSTFIKSFEEKILPGFLDVVSNIPTNSVGANIYESTIEGHDLRVDFEVHPPTDGEQYVKIAIFPWLCVHRPETLKDAWDDGGTPLLIGMLKIK